MQSRMPPSVARTARGVIVAGCVVAACSGGRETFPTAPAGPMDPRLVVAAVPLSIRRDQIDYVVNIPYQYVNNTSSPVANPGCRPPIPPGLQWWTGKEWADAYERTFLLCSSPPFVIGPGASFTDTLRLRIPRDSIGVNGQTQVA